MELFASKQINTVTPGDIVSGVNNGVPYLLRYDAVMFYSSQAKKINAEWVQLLNRSGTEPTEAIADTRAAQILAEMLGIVCHPEYYNSEQEQMVPYPPFSRS